MAADLSSSSQLRYIVTDDNNRFNLAVGTLLEQQYSFEAWDNHGCIESTRSLMGQMRILNGPREGGRIEVILESTYGSSPTEPARWLSALPR